MVTIMNYFPQLPISRRLNYVQPQSVQGGGVRHIALLFLLLASMWSVVAEAQDNNITIMTYFTSEQAFKDSLDASKSSDGYAAMQLLGYDYENSRDATIDELNDLCYWDRDAKAVRFTGYKEGYNQTTNQLKFYVSDSRGPFKLVNENTGFTMSFEAYSDYDYLGTYPRIFDATRYKVGNSGSRQTYFSVKSKHSNVGGTRLEIVTNDWNDATRVGGAAELGYLDKSWNLYTIVVSPVDGNPNLGTARVYIDGIETDLPHETTELTLFESISVGDVLKGIHDFNLSIGNLPAAAKDYQLDGWIRNLQIVSTSKVQYVKLAKSISNGKIYINGIPGTTAGVMVPQGALTSLTEEHDAGYHLDWTKVKVQQQNPNANGWEDPLTLTNQKFTMPQRITRIDADFEPNVYTVTYDWNLDGGTIGGESNPTPLTAGAKGHFSAFTAPSSDLLRVTSDGTVWRLKGWSKTSGSGNSVDFEPGVTYAYGTAQNTYLNTNQTTGKAFEHGQGTTLYAVWEMRPYTVSVDSHISGGTVTVKIGEGEASNSVSGKPGTEVTITATFDDEHAYTQMTSLKVTPEGGDSQNLINSNVTTKTTTYTYTIANADAVVNAIFTGSNQISLKEAVTGGSLIVNGQTIGTGDAAEFVGSYVYVTVEPESNKRLTAMTYNKNDAEVYTPVSDIPSTYDTKTGKYYVYLNDLGSNVYVTATFGDKETIDGNPENLSLTIYNDDKTMIWTGENITPRYTLLKGGYTVGTNEFNVEFYSDGETPAKKAGVGYAKVIMNNNEHYQGSVTLNDEDATFHVKYNLAAANVSVADLVYNGSVKQPAKSDITITINEETASESDFSVTYGTTGSDAGEYTLTSIVADNSSVKFTGQKDNVRYNIVPADLNVWVDESTITTEGTSDTYNVAQSDIDLTGFSVTGVKLKGVNADLGSENYRTAYMSADGSHEYGSTFPANTFGKVYLAVHSKGKNTVGYKLTNKYISVQLPLELANQSWVTYYNDLYNLVTPSDYQAYVVTGVSESASTVTLSTVDYIPKDVPVLLNRTSGTWASTIYADEDVPREKPNRTDEFKGVPTSGGEAVSSLTSQGNVYVLNGGQFVRAKEGTIGANKCYLLVSTASGSRLRLSIGGEGDATGIVDALRDLQQEQWYDLNGRKVNGPQGKGVYIVNGRKVIIK